MSGSELLSKQRIYNIGEYNNLNRLTANTVTLDYLKFGMDTSNVTITYPEDLTIDGYTLALPNRPGISGEFLGIDDSNKLKWGNPNVINNVQFRYGIGLNTAVIDSTYTKGQIIYPENYEITITPTSTTSKLLIQFRCTYIASFSADTAITFYIYKTINNVKTEVQVEANLGPLNATGTNRSQYLTATVIESGTTDPIKISIAFAFNNIVDIAAQVGKIGILGENDYSGLNPQGGYSGYKNSIMVTDFEGSGAYSTLLSKSHDNESIYYNLGTLFLGSNYNSLNTNNTSSLSLITEDGISAPLFIGHLQGNVTGNYVITDNITCLNLTSNVIDTNILNGNIITTDELYSNIFTTNTLTSNIITSNMITTYDISINNSLKTKDLDVFGNLHVHGTQTIVNSEILNIADNIIIVNADGNIEKQAGIQANIDGNLYDFFFDICLNGWSIYNKNLHLNKLLGNNISLTENITAQWLNGNINSNFVNVLGNININDNYILDVSAIKFSDGSFFNSNILNEKIDTLQGNVSNIFANITTMKTDISNNKGNITTLQGNVSNIFANITTMKTDISNNKGNIITLQGNVSNIFANITTMKTDISNNKGNITTLQGNVSNIFANITTMKSDISNNKGNITTLQGNVSNIFANITTMKADISNNKGNITTLQGNVSNIFANITTMKSDISNNKGNIITLQGNVSNIFANITTMKTDISNNKGNITTLQGNVSNIFANITTMKTDISNNKGNIITLQGNVSNIFANITTMKSDISNNKGNIITLQGNVSNIFANITTMKTDISNNKGNITTLQGNVSNIFANITTMKTDISNNKGNIITLQGNVSNIFANITTMKSDISNNKGNIITLQGNVSNIFANITTMKTDISNNKGNITTLQGNVSNIFANITTMKTDISNNKGNIITLQGNVSNIFANITTMKTDISNNKGNIITLQGNINQELKTTSNVTFNSLSIAKSVTINGNLIVRGNTTFVDSVEHIITDALITLNSKGLFDPIGIEGNTNTGNTIQFVFEQTKNYWHTGGKSIKANIIGDILGTTANLNNLNMFGNINLNNNYILDVSAITFGNGKYINGNSISDLQSNVAILQGNIVDLQNKIDNSYTSNSNVIFNDISANGNLNVSNNVLFKKDLIVNGNILANKFIGELSGNSLTSNKWKESKLLNVNGNVSGNVVINANETMNLSLELEFFGNSGIYGNSNVIPILKIDNYGRIISISFEDLTFTAKSSIDATLISTDILATRDYIQTDEIRGGNIEIYADEVDFNSARVTIRDILSVNELLVNEITITSAYANIIELINSNNLNDISLNGNIKADNAIIKNNIIMNNGHILDVSAIKFSDGNYFNNNILNNKINIINSNIGNVFANITTMKSDISNNKGNITTLQGNVSNIFANITTMKSDISNNKGNITTLQGNVSNIFANITTMKSDISNNKENITTLQGNVSNIFSNITTMKTDISNNKGNITTLQGNVSNIFANITTMKTDISNNKGNITTLQCNVSNIFANITTMKTDISNNKGNITTLQGNISNIFANITTMKTDISNNKGNITTLQGNVSNIFANITTMKTDISNNKGNITTLQGNVSNIFANITTMKSEISNNKGNITTLLSKIDQPVKRSSNVTFNKLTISDEVIINGNLTIRGNTTIVDSIEHVITDALITLNSKGLSDPIGIEGNTSNGNIIQFIFDQTNNYWDTGGKAIKANIIGDISGTTGKLNNLNMIGNINLNNNYWINYVSGIKFADGSTLTSNVANITTMKTDISNNKGNIITLQGNVSNIFANITTMKSDISNNKGNIITLQGNVSNIFANITTMKADISNNKGNIITLQGNVSNIFANITTMKADISNNKGNIITLQGNVSNIFANITTMKSEISNNKGNITTLQGNVSNIFANITTMKADISNNKGNIITLQGNVSNIFANITTMKTDISNNKGNITTLLSKIDQPLKRSSNVTFNKLTISDEVIINGNLTIRGNTTIVDSIEYIINDPLITLNSNGLNGNIGIQGNTSNGNTIEFVFDQTNNYWYTGGKSLKANIIGDILGNTGKLNNLNMFGNINLNNNYILDVSTIIFENGKYINGNSISNLQSNLAILQGNIVDLQNKIENSYTSNSNVIFNDISANGNLNVSNNVLFKKELTVDGNILASKFIGELSGNSLTSNKWKESKILNVNGNVNGNVLINANETMDLSLELENFGKSGIYGNNNSFPIITIDNYGRITDISLVNITFTGGSSVNTDIGDILNVQYISTDILATSGYIRTNKIIGSSIIIDSNDLSVEGILTATHINADSITIANGSITVNKIISSNAIFTNDITVSGNLSVIGTQTILNSTIVEIDDNIIIVNADGELLKEAGLSANIGGNLYDFLYDICSNSWTTKNNNLTTNKLNMLGNIVLDNSFIIDVSAIKFSDGTFFNNNIFNTNIESINSNIASVWGNITTMKTDISNNTGNITTLQSKIDQPVKSSSNVTFNKLTVSDEVTINGNLIVRGNKTIVDSVEHIISDALITLNSKGLSDPIGIEGNTYNGNIIQFIFDQTNNYWDTGGKAIKSNIIGDISGRTGNLNNLNMFGNINLKNNYWINDVSGIKFSDGTTLTSNVANVNLNNYSDASFGNIELSGNLSLTGNNGLVFSDGTIINSALAAANLISQDRILSDLTLIKHVLDYYLHDINLSSNTFYQTINEININGNIKGNSFNGKNANISGNVNALWFNGNLSGTDASLSNNVNASWFNGNLSGTDVFLSNNVNASWFNGNLNTKNINNILEISGNIIYPINTDVIDFGYHDINNNSNDKRFNFGFFKKVKATTGIFTGNITLDNSFIIDVSAIKFSDGTFFNNNIFNTNIESINSNIASVWGNITTMKTDISNNTGNITTLQSKIDQPVKSSSNVTFNKLTVSDEVTINGNLIVRGNKTIVDSVEHIISDALITLNSKGLSDPIGIEGNTYNGNIIQFIFDQTNNYWDTGGKAIKSNIIGDISGRTGNLNNLNMFGNINLKNNYWINDVSGIKFSDGTTLTSNVANVNLNNYSDASFGNIELSGNLSLTGNNGLVFSDGTIINSALAAANLISQDRILSDLTLIKHVLDYYLHDINLSSNTFYQTINEININGNIKGNSFNGKNANISGNVNALWFNGNLSGTDASLSNNVNASWFNGNLSGTDVFLSNNVNASWFNGNLNTKNINNILEISGNIIYPINTDVIDFGYHDINNNSNDKRFNFGFFKKVKATTGIFTGNITLDNSFIIDVSAIKFSDGTFFNNNIFNTNIESINSNIASVWGNITMKTDISNNTGNITTLQSKIDQPVKSSSNVTFNKLTVSDEVTINGNLIVRGNKTIVDSVEHIISDALITLNSKGLSDPIGIEGNTYNGNIIQFIFDQTNNYWDTGGKAIKSNIIGDISGRTGNLNNLNMFGNINLKNNYWINDVSGIKFSDGTTLTSNVANVNLNNYSDASFGNIELSGNLSLTGNNGLVFSDGTIINSALAAANLISQDRILSDLTLIKHVLDYYLHDINLSSNTFYQTINEININGNIKGNSFNGKNANISGNVNALWFNGNINSNFVNIDGNINFINGNTGIYYNNYNYIEKRNSKLKLVLNNVWPYPSIEEPNQIQEYLKIYGSNLFLDSSSGLIIIGNDSAKNSDNCIQMNSRSRFNGYVDFKSPVYFNTNAELNGRMNINQQGLSINGGTGSYFKKCKVYIGPDFIGGTNSITFDPNFTSKLGIYTLDPQAALDVSATSIFRDTIRAEDISLNGNLYARRINFPSGNYIDDTEGVKILYVDETSTFNGDSSFNSNVNILGNLTVNGTFTNSDKRLKENNIDIINGIELIKKLKPQIYDKRNKLELDDNNYYIKESGFIAQDIEEVEELKHLINKPKNIEKEPYTMNYIGLIAYNTAATKELDNIVEQQKIKINSQENRIQQLENKVLSQETLINQLISRIEALENS